eukprot:scaffold15920_cov129-Isochrysis_galbana.AAC.3
MHTQHALWRFPFRRCAARLLVLLSASTGAPDGAYRRALFSFRMRGLPGEDRASRHSFCVGAWRCAGLNTRQTSRPSTPSPTNHTTDDRPWLPGASCRQLFVAFARIARSPRSAVLPPSPSIPPCGIELWRQLRGSARLPAATTCGGMAPALRRRVL